MAFAGKVFKKCPECEGYGKTVNYFDLPKIIFGLGMHIERISTEVRTSRGREYIEKSTCSVCNGIGLAWQF